MRQLRNLFVAIVTAPELLVAVIAWLVFVYYPTPIIYIGDRLVAESESWKYITALPFALTVWSVKAAKDIRRPGDKDMNKVLFEWPHYSLLVGRVYLAVLLSGLCSVVAFLLFISGKEVSHGLIGLIFVIAMLVSVTVAATLTFAGQKLVELLTLYS